MKEEGLKGNVRIYGALDERVEKKQSSKEALLIYIFSDLTGTLQDLAQEIDLWIMLFMLSLGVAYKLLLTNCPIFSCTYSVSHILFSLFFFSAAIN